MVLLDLFVAFFRTGLFTIGGGYAMLPLIQQDMERHGWLTAEEFIDIIAIAEVTPGPIAVNAATFVGFKTAGVWGSLLATGAVALPSLLIIVSLARFWEKYHDHPITKAVFAGVRPAVAGLIAAAAVVIARAALIGDGPQSEGFHLLGVDPRSLLIAAAVFAAVRWRKADPIRTISAAAVAGLILFSL